MFQSPRYNRLRIVADDEVMAGHLSPEPSPSPSPSLSASALPMLVDVASYNSTMSSSTTMSSVSCTPTPSIASTSMPPPLSSAASIPSISRAVPCTVAITCASYSAQSSEQLMRWMDEILFYGDRNVSYFQQFLSVEPVHLVRGNTVDGVSCDLSA